MPCTRRAPRTRIDHEEDEEVWRVRRIGRPHDDGVGRRWLRAGPPPRRSPVVEGRQARRVRLRDVRQLPALRAARGAREGRRVRRVQARLGGSARAMRLFLTVLTYAVTLVVVAAAALV